MEAGQLILAYEEEQEGERVSLRMAWQVEEAWPRQDVMEGEDVQEMMFPVPHAEVEVVVHLFGEEASTVCAPTRPMKRCR